MNNNLPPNWSWVKLGDVSEFSQGIQVEIKKQSDKKLKNYVRFLRIIDFTQGKDEPRYVENPGERYYVKKDDLSMVRYGAVGFICRGLEGVIANNLFKIIPDKKVEKGFLFYFFKAQYFLNELKLNVKGATMPAISFSFIKGLNFPLPTLPEQKKIVAKIEELFSELDNGIEQLKKAKQQLKIYRQAVLSYAFTGRLRTNLIHQIPTNQIPTKTKTLKAAEPQVSYNPKDLPEDLPSETSVKEGWKWVKLGDVTEKVKMIQRKNLNQEEEFIYYDIGGINNSVNKIESFKKYKWKEAPSRARQIVKKGDILFSTVRTYLKNIALLTNEFDNQIASTGFCVIRPKEKVLSSKYVFHYTLYKEFLEPLNALQTGSSYPAVRDNDVFNQVIPLPPFLQQQQIVEEIEKRFSEADNLEKTIDESLQKSETLRQSILKRAFEGKL